MMNELKMGALRTFSFILMVIAISTVNSVCWYNFGQEKEPESLKRFKK